ncbi:PAS domain-containing protein [Rhodomicrobium vannielii ATCC 17100]|jgi:hypothetical protein|uniref:PAS domain-containing protein n=1 Tax=Rhodomicrobium udaipurense TaxID=1202716 RepID=A0A8I1GJ89_9HYPH|nr:MULTISPECIES: PAS domain-containing protein [Rhodomicrobium]MBJ7535018.1 PAS domain-containing protein [Rhodomicrobium vannielii ATCC 17100]MBJ7545015.1 PAS domain-containing protein [Rhodomicrobium udaipurense]
MASEISFRAQVIMREQQELYGYWRACAQSRPLPSRFDIDPIAIPHLLSGLSLLDCGEDLESLRYRLAGTRVGEIYGAEITGRAVFDIGFQHKRDYWRTVYRSVIEDQLPMQGTVRGPAAGREHLLLIWLRLPLSGLSGKVERILGYDAAIPATFAHGAPQAHIVGERVEKRRARL